MALINCPECNKKVSERAVLCVHCGFPLSEYLEEKAEVLDETENVEDSSDDIKTKFPELPILVAMFDKDYLFTYDNGNIVISQDDVVIYDGDIKDIEIHGFKKSFLHFGRVDLYVKNVPSELYCKSAEDYEVCKLIIDDYHLRTKEKRAAIEARIKEREEASSIAQENMHYYVETSNSTSSSTGLIIGLLKVLFLPIYIPILLIFGVLKLIGLGSVAADIFKKW